MNNLHVSYDLNSPGQNYEAVIARIKQLGSWAKVHKSFWYVKSTYTAEQAVSHINEVMDGNDQVYVVDATNNHAAWNYLPANVVDHIKAEWWK